MGMTNRSFFFYKKNKIGIYMRDDACYNCKCKKEMAIKAKGGK